MEDKYSIMSIENEDDLILLIEKFHDIYSRKYDVEQFMSAPNEDFPVFSYKIEKKKLNITYTKYHNDQFHLLDFNISFFGQNNDVITIILTYKTKEQLHLIDAYDKPLHQGQVRIKDYFPTLHPEVLAIIEDLFNFLQLSRFMNSIENILTQIVGAIKYKNQIQEERSKSDLSSL